MALVSMETLFVEESELAEKVGAKRRVSPSGKRAAVGAFCDNECFGQQYDLPNDAYLENCVGVARHFSEFPCSA